MGTVETTISAVEAEVKQFIARHQGKSKELDARMLAIEQALTRGTFGGAGFDPKDIGALIIQSENFAAFQKGSRSSGQIEVRSFKASPILSGTWTTGPDYRPTMAAPPQPRLTVRALMPTITTAGNLIEFPREDSHSGGPGYQTPEGTDKPQIDFAYSLQQAAVATLAHWLAASKQLVDDSAAFSGYVNGRMLYLLESKVEHELLYGDGLTGHLKGIATQATAASGSPPADLIAGVGAAISQLAAVGVEPDAVVANPVDWWTARQLKATGSGNFLVGDPLSSLTPTLWGLNVALTPSITQGHFVVGAFRTQAAVFDRQQATIELSREHDTFFTKNLVAILCEERLALVVFRPDAFVYGGLVGAGS